MNIPVKRITILSLSAALLFAAACSSSKDGGPGGASVPVSTISGAVVAAPVSGAEVVVRSANGDVIAGPVSTSSDGTYTIQVPASAFDADLRIESTGGTFTDEATGQPATAGILAAYMPAGSAADGASVHIDPSSTIIHGMVTAGTRTFGEAQDMVNSAFGFTPDCSVASKNTSSTGAGAAERLKALRAAAFSRLTRDLGLTPDQQSALLTALAQDLADDGELDGSTGTAGAVTIPEDIRNRFENALVSMLSDTEHNQTGLTPGEIGEMPFSKVALTASYRVEYIDGMMTATQGKSSFKIKITNRSDGSAATGLAVSLKPMMHMSSMGHSTPAAAVVEEGAGMYDCAAYYLMASGAGMGYWELKVTVGASGETAIFYPHVGMAMGADTVRATLSGPDDAIVSMAGTTSYNKYYLFRDGPVTSATATLDLFIAHGEMKNMNFIPVSPGSVLSSPTGTVTSMALLASTDSSFATAVTGTAVDNGNGRWSLPGLDGLGLVSGQTSTIYVRLNINGQDKTTDGKAPSGANSAAFLITPGM